MSDEIRSDEIRPLDALTFCLFSADLDSALTFDWQKMPYTLQGKCTQTRIIYCGLAERADEASREPTPGLYP